MKIYLSGPMSGHDNYNRATFAAAKERIERDGTHEVVNPAESDNANDDGTPWTWEQYIAEDCKTLLLGEFDAIALIPGWHASRGSRIESFIAASLCLPMLDAETLEPLDIGWSIAQPANED